MADPGLMAEWAAAYRVRLLAAAGALCGDRVEAEDLLQETFSEAMASLARFEGRSAPYTWLYGILRRRFLLHCRRRRRFLRWAAAAGRLPASESIAEPSMAVDAAGEAARDPRLEAVAKALRTLSVKHREILHLRYVEGRKIAEIAALVSASEGTVKSRLHHALRRVKSAIGRDENGSLVAAREKIHEL
ncbi:MAG: RNA polymerase sigma factor [Acidobacteriota bacterium]|nr:RNA polymerase sigma factor [Acidobacteriota bacterium]